MNGHIELAWKMVILFKRLNFPGETFLLASEMGIIILVQKGPNVDW